MSVMSVMCAVGTNAAGLLVWEGHPMNAADFAAMSDPELNPKFSRRWEEVGHAVGRGSMMSGPELNPKVSRRSEEPQNSRSPVLSHGDSCALDGLAVLVSEDWRSARVVRNQKCQGENWTCVTARLR
jgi:hypothetical protein